ncbi:MAG: ATP-binding cassette domain-containing protein [Alphaproteobacteria bacterium]|nr:ATP-binding cassette domain-containing protein [Alphaproteobacteria bacterium]
MAAAIKIDNLSKHFMGLKAIDGLSVTFPCGVATGLIGPNGSGKTTLMNVLTGLLIPDSGSIEIDGHNPRHKIMPTELRALKIARTFQDGRLIEQLSVEDNLLLTVAESDPWKSFFDFKRSKKVGKVLKTVHLTAQRHKLAGSLSYGQRKLLEIGRTLMQDADIYFFDEPFTGLFPEVVEQVLTVLQDLKAKGKTLVVIEHNMGLIERLCDYTIVLNHGQLLAQGVPAKVLKNDQVQEAYLGI